MHILAKRTTQLAMIAAAITLTGCTEENVKQGQPVVVAPAAPAAMMVAPATSSTVVTQTVRDDGPIDSIGSGAIPDLPLQVREANGISYLTGGIGDEEEAQIKSSQHQYNTRLLLTATGGEYISEANVNISKAGSSVLSADGVGPYFYTQLPPGSYSAVITTKAGVSKTVKFKVPASGAYSQHLVFAE
jgi:hypothetical protein